MSLQTVRFRTSDEYAAEVVEQIEALFEGVRAAAPSQLRYIAFRDADEPVFTLILELPEGADNPLPLIAAAADFRAWLPSRTDDDPIPRVCTVLGRCEK